MRLIRSIRILAGLAFATFLAIPLSAQTPKDTAHVKTQKPPIDTVTAAFVQACAKTGQTVKMKAACRNYMKLAPNEAALLVGSGPGPVPPAPPVATTITVTPANAGLFIGDSIRATAAVTDQYGQPMSTGVTWSVGNTGIASVTATGIVKGVGVGATTVRASSGNANGILALTVTAKPPPTPIGVTPPELPRAYVTTKYPAFPGTVRNVAAGGDLQGALDAAQPGDQIVLAPGATYSGNYVVPNKAACASTASYIVVRSGGMDSDYPSPGTRIAPSYAPKLAKIVTPNVAPAIFVHGGACKWFISRVEITATAQSSSVSYNYGLVRVGEGEGTVDWQPSDIVFDRVYVHGNPVSVQHALILNGVRNAIIDSYVSDVHWVGVESHAIASWAGAGPFKIVNNYLDGAGVNIEFGGADPTLAGISPSDIEIRGNYLFKPLSYKGQGYAVKNLLELKHAKRVLIEGNMMENSWGDAQIGWAVIFQSATDRPDLGPQTQTADVTMRYNIIKNVWGGADLTANGYNGSGIPATRIAIENNLFDNIGGGGTSTGVQLLNGLTDITVRHNTILRNTEQYGMPFSLDGGGAGRIAIADNLVGSSTPYSSVFKTGGATGSTALTQFAGTAWTYVGNTAWSDVAPSGYPSGNNWAASQAAVGFAGDWSLAASSPYKGKASDGKDPGADIVAIKAATAGAAQAALSARRIPVKKP